MSLAEALTSPGVLLLDGAMGTELAEHGLDMGGQTCVSHPDVVLSVHHAYAEAGSRALTTNTLTMNRVYIETHGVGVNVREVNAAGAQLARQAAGDRLFVLGDISSTGRIIEPYGDLPESVARDAFAEQARVLADGGVDGFIVETMFDLREAMCALEACRAAAQLPVIVTLAFSSATGGARTMMGDAAERAARVLGDAGAAAIGANCGELDPSAMANVIVELVAASDLPVVAQPNAGRPTADGNRAVFEMTADDFAAGVGDCLRGGACIVGGCCGTTPGHIRALRAELQRMGR